MLDISKLESALFLCAKPMTIKALCAILQAEEEDIRSALDTLEAHRNTADSGIHLVRTETEATLVTNPTNAEVLELLSKEEIVSELTNPQLETLTIVAYRSPITKPEIEQIRGVNCSLILRNLQIRGLIREKSHEDHLLPVYEVTLETLRYLGIHRVEELDAYESLHSNPSIDRLLEGQQTPKSV